MKIKFVCFSSEEFLPRAKVAIASVKQHHPDAEVELVLLQEVASGNYIEGLAKKRLQHIKKDIFNFDVVVLLGADCVFYSPVPEYIFINSTAYDITLTPHVTRFPKKFGAQLYRTGHANADFILFNKNSLKILHWLLDQEMVDDSHNGIFYEQTWLSALPFLTSKCWVLRDYPQINYAYFNMHERNLELTEEGWTVNKKPLVMAQFSGYEEGKPERMSKHYPGPDITGYSLLLLQNYDADIKGQKT